MKTRLLMMMLRLPPVLGGLDQGLDIQLATVVRDELVNVLAMPFPSMVLVVLQNPLKVVERRRKSVRPFELRRYHAKLVTIAKRSD